MDKFNLYIDKIDLNFWRELCTKEGKLRSYKKGEYFLHRGDIPKYFGFIAQGYFEYSVIDTDGNSNITGFAFCNTLVGDYYGSVKKMPSLTDIIAVKCSKSFPKNYFMKLIKDISNCIKNLPKNDI